MLRIMHTLRGTKVQFFFVIYKTMALFYAFPVTFLALKVIFLSYGIGNPHLF